MLQRAVADLRALAHPLRLRMMELFAESPKTTKQVAEILGQPPTRLYHHVAALERSGLLVLKERRKNRGTVEKWYAGVAQQVRAAGSRRDTATGRRARRAVAATVLEQTKQELVAMPPHAREAALLGRLVLALPPSKIPAIRKLLFDTVRRLGARFRSSAGMEKDVEKDCERWAVTVAFAPVTSRPEPTRRGRRPRP
jgi:DNA-binding transcriptional ArsR family regulator